MENKENTLQKPGFWQLMGAYGFDFCILLWASLYSLSMWHKIGVLDNMLGFVLLVTLLYLLYFGLI